MLNQFLDTSIEYLKGVGPKRGEMLKKEFGIFTFYDLLIHYPFRYVDRSKFYKVNEINSDLAYVQLKGKISYVQTIGKARGSRLIAGLVDDTGEIEMVWFQGQKWIKDKIKAGKEYIVFGKPSVYNYKFNLAHPEIEAVEDFKIALGETLQPVYSSTEKAKSKGLDSRGLGKLIKTLLVSASGKINESLPNTILKDLRLIQRYDALVNIHFPKDPQILKKAQARLKFEELFFIQLKLIRYKQLRLQKFKGHVFSQVGAYFNSFYKNNLDFELTTAQKRVMKEIRADLGSGKQMNRLLQGDVGSGKTIVALMTMLIALDNNFQACLMAPTEILAQQHFETIQYLLKELGISVKLLTGSTKTADRNILHNELLSGELQLLIGTHALIEETVQFRNLGVVIIDEQHRFGVAQRARLWKKNITPPHMLVMTATPIPRTLAMTLYGDLDYSVIDELPPGRKAVKTYHFYDKERLKVFGFLKKQIKQDRQVYVVYPLIEESQKMDLKDLMDGYESISREFPLPQFAISIVHGKMKSSDKEYEMQRFVKRETQIMVATTVIEVGVDIPNASVMVIENAERFGLSQLHQLRGRVGRGADQSHCILMTSYKLTNEGRKRIETMISTTDGFEVAEVDLQLRGPGDLEGTQQSGIIDLKLADIVRDEKVLKYARNLAIEIIEKDPALKEPQNKPLLFQLNFLNKRKSNWSLIS
ncbi:ATP-dependent DNA helicase RecG [candidate division KSB1 bacterium]